MLLEFGYQGTSIGEAEDGRGFLLATIVLKAAQDLFLTGDLGALASGWLSQLVGNIHQIFGQRTPFGSSQIGDFVAGLRTAKTAQTAAVDGRVEEDNLIGVDGDADPVAGRVQLDESVASLANDGEELLFGIPDLMEWSGIAQNMFHLVDLDLHVAGIDFNLFAIEINRHDLVEQYVII